MHAMVAHACTPLVVLQEKTTRDELNHFLFKQATYGPYCHQIGYSVNEVRAPVSTAGLVWPA